MSEAPMDRDRLLPALAKSLPEGRLPRIPKHPERRDAVLALLCRDVTHRRPYDELEINAVLRDGLEAMHADVDHVTARRYLVDFGFLKRDAHGQRYFLNGARLKQAITEEALASADAVLTEALAQRRRQMRPQPLSNRPFSDQKSGGKAN